MKCVLGKSRKSGPSIPSPSPLVKCMPRPRAPLTTVDTTQLLCFTFVMALTQTDFDQIEHIIGEVVNGKTKHLPTTNDFYNKKDEVMGELKGIREEITTLSHHSSDHSQTLENHEDRLTTLEASTSPATA